MITSRITFLKTAFDPPVSDGLVALSWGEEVGGFVFKDSSGNKTPIGIPLSNGTASSLTLNGYTEGSDLIGSGNNNTVGASVTLDISAATNLLAKLVDAQATTFTMPPVGLGKSFMLLLRQAEPLGTGTATFTGVKWNSAGAPVVTQTAGKQDIFTFVSDGTHWYGTVSQGYDYTA